jgi:predicted nucleotidyltransferase
MSRTANADRGLVNLAIPEALYPALACFVDYAKNIPNLRFAVLFGSTVTGEFRHKSDIDILLAFETDHDPEFGPEAEAALDVSAFIASKYDLAHSFSFVYANLRDPNLDPHFLWQVAKEGIVLWGDPTLFLESMARARAEAWVLITYSTRGLDAATKGALHRYLYGYQVSKRVHGKEYHSARPGVLAGSGRKIAPGVLLVSAQAADPLLAWLDSHKVPHTVTKVWS